MRSKLQNSVLTIFFLAVPLSWWGCTDQKDYLNYNLSVDERVEDLVSQMTVEEKILQMSHLAPGIERLGVIPYDPNLYNPLGDNFEVDEDEIQEFEERTGLALPTEIL